MSFIERLFDSVAQENRQTIFQMTEPNSKATVLDLGCGSGEFTREIATKVGTKKVCGIEFIEELAQLAEEKGIKVYRADLNNKLPLEDEGFDFVCANQVIEHLYETDLFIKEIHRVLKPNGYAIVSTPNLASLHNITSLVFGKQPFPAHISNEVIVGLLIKSLHVEHEDKGSIHLRAFTYSGLRELFEYHKLKVERIVGVGFYPFPHKIARL